ncbi:MAG: metal ABC transporter permease [Ignavibacteriae bacterium]|nr:metal ABC transporter permease [Ignavibacteriota bacterium]
MEQLFYIPETMLWPLMACLVLTGILAYLGVHVIARQVIFVDLALAQIAALGTVTGVLLGYEVGKDVNALYFYSLAFTFLGAFIFSMTKMRGEKVPHEAIIGIVYAVAFAATILVLARSPLGPQELDRIIKGELLWVQAPLVIKTAIIYLIIGFFHFLLRSRFIPISFNSAKASALGMNVRWWDFLFYMSFGFVITSSVAIAGVFLVFSYLVIPAVGAMLLSDKLSTRLAIGWIAGAIISFIGVKLSWHTGLPTSPLIVVLLALALIVSATIRYVRTSEKRIPALRNALASLLLFVLFVAGIFLLRKPEEDPLQHTLHLLNSSLSTDRQTALAQLGSFAEQKDHWIALAIEKLGDQDVEVRKAAIELLTRIQERSALPNILNLLDDHSFEVKKSALEAVRSLGDSAFATKLVDVAKKEDDPELRTTMLETALELGNSQAIPPLIEIAKEGGIFADDAYDALRGHVQLEFRRDEIGKVQQWWNKNHEKVEWNEKNKTFFVKR